MKKLFEIFSLDESQKRIAYQEAKNIIHTATSFTDYLCMTENNEISLFDYDITFYEELYFLYCIESVRLINSQKESKLFELIKNEMFLSLINMESTQFKKKENILKEVLNQRTMYYLPLINQYNYKLNDNFFITAFEYQSEILATPYKNKTENKEKIKSILMELLEDFKRFYNTWI